MGPARGWGDPEFVNSLHIPPELSVRIYFGGVRAMADYRVYLVGTDGNFCGACSAKKPKVARRLFRLGSPP